MPKTIIKNPGVRYAEDHIEADYDYATSVVQRDGDTLTVTPHVDQLTIRTSTKVPKLGVMLVGWGGNNGTTFTAGIVANKLGLSWPTKRGTQTANWYGSLTQASTVRLGRDAAGRDVHVPLGSVVPTVDPADIVVDGWDVSSMNIADAARRAAVLDPPLQRQLRDALAAMRPRPTIYDPAFVAANQADRADNALTGRRSEQVAAVVADIEQFRRDNALDEVIVMWTANTERFSEVIEGVHDTAENLAAAIKNDHPEVSPSTLFAYAAILTKSTYINGSPQNTFVPGLVEMAEREGVAIAGDDFKSGQTKLKSVLVDFLVGAGIKPVSIVSYNHLGNNDGKNLSAPQQFRSKEISKSNVVDDVVASNGVLYAPGEKPDHCVVIKYVPYVGDSKRAMDEYTSEIMCGGTNTIVVHNTCEDSLLAAPIVLDLIVLAELCGRVRFKRRDAPAAEYAPFHPALSVLGYLCKAPLVPPGAPVVNALFKQRACIENVLRACVGLPPDSHMTLEHKVPFLMRDAASAEPDPKKAKIVNGSR